MIVILYTDTFVHKDFCEQTTNVVVMQWVFLSLTMDNKLICGIWNAWYLYSSGETILG